MDLTLFMLMMLSFASVCAYVAARKDLPYRQWFVLGVLLGFVALIIVLIQPSRRPTVNDA